MPVPFRKEKPFDPRLVTKTSLGNPKGAMSLMLLLWLANDKPSEVSYGSEPSEGALSLDETNLAKLAQYLEKNTALGASKEQIEKWVEGNPLLASQIESLKAAFELIWHMGLVRFTDETIPTSKERTGGVRYPKTIMYTSNADIASVLFEENPEGYLRVLVSWLAKETIEHNLDIETRFEKMLAALAETSFYKTSKGDEGTVYVPAGVYRALLRNDGEVNLNSGGEAQGPTRIFKSLVSQGMNPYLKNGGNGVTVADNVSINELEAYTNRAENTLALSKVEIKNLESGEEGNHSIDTEGLPHNLIYFGAPGTGKSYTLNEKAKQFDEDKVERVTFHPDYTYAQFVGTLKPHSGVNVEGKHEIYYAFTPGPFIDTYVNALNDPDHKYLLIIEELNRANPAAVFGDVFQLLDRDAQGSSDYPVKTSEDLKQYLAEKLLPSKPSGEREEIASNLSLPSNMYIWATMNSADQGVFPMDTAFKRRWDFQYMDINGNEDAIKDMVLPLGKTQKSVKWNDMRRAINKVMQEARINEDKFLGPFFIDPDLADDDNFVEMFKSKVLLYLVEDAAKTKKEKVFGNGSISYSVVSGDFDTKGEAIFPDLEDLTYIEDLQGDDETSAPDDSTDDNQDEE